MAAFTAPSVPKQNEKISTEKVLKQGFEGVNLGQIMLVNTLFSPGNLPDLITVPDPAQTYVVDKVVKDEKDRSKENRSLKQKVPIVKKI